MYFIAKHITLFGLMSTVCCKVLFQKFYKDFDNTFCAHKILPHGMATSSTECAKLCFQMNWCTGFLFDEEKYCFLTEEQLSHINACSFQTGSYFIKGMLFFCYQFIINQSNLVFIHRDEQSNT